MPIIKDVERYSEILSKSSTFSSFEEDELQELIQHCERKILAPRESLWAVGAKGDAAFILIEGRVEQTKRLPPDGQRVEHFSQPGTILGLSYLVQGWNHQSAASVAERSEFLRLSKSRFQEMFDAQESASFHLVDHIAENLVAEMRDANRRLHEVFGNPAETLRTLRRRVRTI